MKHPAFTRRQLFLGTPRADQAGDQQKLSLLEDERGATGLEYALIAALVGLTLWNGATILGRRTRQSLNCSGRTVRRASRGRSPPRCAG
ncbi:MAG: Flp family type IVb pilin [Pseudomonadota bacterium]